MKWKDSKVIEAIKRRMCCKVKIGLGKLGNATTVEQD